MIKLVDLTYYSHLNYKHPRQVFENHTPALAFASYLKNKINFNFVKHASFEEQAIFDGIPYFFFKGGNRFWSLSFKTHRFIKELKPDIVLVQGFVFPLQVIFLRLFCGKNFKIIIQHHGELPFSGTKGLFQKIACSMANGFIFTAAGNADLWRKKKIIKTGSNIFELLEASTVFKKQDKQISKKHTGITNDTNFLWVGRLNVNKDPLTVLNGFAPYLQINPEAKLFMIYQTEDMLAEIMQILSSSQSLSNAVVLVGRVQNEELPYWYSAADFYVSGSHKEGSGYALLEALACGCIPIVTAIPPYQKIIGNSKCGFLYSPGDVGALTQLFVIVNKLDREKLSAAALSHFNKNLTAKNIANNLFDICNYLMAE